jgi:hypothetical protein
MTPDPLMHLLARTLLRIVSPMRARSIMMGVGALFPAATPSELRRASERLSKRGTCLSRALALSARTPASEVVIGVHLLPGAELSAHAWLEIDGKPFDALAPAGAEIARLQGRKKKASAWPRMA